jgi:hypothetical protein
VLINSMHVSCCRCLVCDRQLRPTSPRPGSPGSPQVPLLDSFAATGQGAGGGQGLMGAGFNAAELRRQRAAGSTSPPGGSSHRCGAVNNQDHAFMHPTIRLC